MESTETLATLITLAAVTGVGHTLAGPDHYLPFVVMSRSRGWSGSKTSVITLLCGLGHVLGSVVLGAVGIAAGTAVYLTNVESVRGTVAAWLMIAFGLVYAAWGLRRWARRKVHTHAHAHRGGVKHAHAHDHEGGHVHVHDLDPSARSITPWVLFTIFVFGPCEVLIPLLMIPAAEMSLGGLVMVTLVFGLATIGTMLAVVLALRFGFQNLRIGWLERNAHAVAGFTIMLCGALILLGL